MKKLAIFVLFTALGGLQQANCQWSTNGNHIYNTNSGFVGIGTNVPSTLLYVAKNMTEPNITVRNMGGTGGATFTMTDDASGANWKFKATLLGGFKIRDHANSLDVITIEPNSFTNAICIKSTDNIGMGTASPHSSAALDITSTTKGMLMPRMTQAQIGAIQNPANGLQVYCTTDGKMYIFVALSNQWKELAYGSGTILPPFESCGDDMTVYHIAGAVAPISITVTYGTANNIPGESSKCWITRNLGASQQATAVNDATEASAGWYWQFNKQQGYKHDGTTRTPNTTWISSISENSDWQTVNDPCLSELGVGWHLPSYTEYYNIDNAGGWTTWNGPWNSALKMHAAGHLLQSNGSLTNRGTYCYYWSRTQGSNTIGWNLFFFSGDCSVNDYNKANGFSVRCVRD